MPGTARVDPSHRIGRRQLLGSGQVATDDQAVQVADVPWHDAEDGTGDLSERPPMPIHVSIPLWLPEEQRPGRVLGGGRSDGIPGARPHHCVHAALRMRSPSFIPGGVAPIRPTDFTNGRNGEEEVSSARERSPVRGVQSAHVKVICEASQCPQDGTPVDRRPTCCVFQADVHHQVRAQLLQGPSDHWDSVEQDRVLPAQPLPSLKPSSEGQVLARRPGHDDHHAAAREPAREGSQRGSVLRGLHPHEVPHIPSQVAVRRAVSAIPCPPSPCSSHSVG